MNIADLSTRNDHSFTEKHGRVIQRRNRVQFAGSPNH